MSWNKLALAATVALGIATQQADAAPQTRKFDLVSSDFSLMGGYSGIVPPLNSTVHMSFVVTFDPATTPSAATAGLTIKNIDLPYSPFQYAYANNILAVGGWAQVQYGNASCGFAEQTFCTFIYDPFGAFPFDFWSIQTPADPSLGVYSSFSNRLTVTSVPEPASWGMMIAGMAAAGGLMRRRGRGVPRLA
jgi:hypothetical protein